MSAPKCKLCKKPHWLNEGHAINTEHLTASNGGNNASNGRGNNKRDSAEASNGVAVAGVGGEDSQRVEAGATSPGASQAGERKGLKQRWSRESYNAYMKGYMARRRQAAYRERGTK